MKVENNMLLYVVDTSVIAAIILPDEEVIAEIKKIYDEFVSGKVDFVAPDLFNLEMANVLKKNVLRKRFSQSRAIEYYSQFKELNIPVETVKDEEVLRLAFEEDLSAYDAAYLWLSRKKKVSLLTLDKKLRQVIL